MHSAVDAATTTAPRATDRIRAVGQPSRLVLAVVLVAASPLVHGSTRDEQVRVALIVAVGWLPLSSLCAAAGRRRPVRVVDLASLVIDLALLVCVQAVLAPSPVVLVVAHLLVVAYYTYLDGKWMGVVAGFAGLVFVTAAASAAADRGSQGFDPFVVAVYPFVVASLAWLLDAAASERAREAAHVAQLHEKSDAILTGVAEAVMVTSRHGVVQQWNRAAEQTFACPRDRAVGNECAAVLGLRLGVRELDCSGGCAVLAAQHAAHPGGVDDVEVWRAGATGQRQPLLATAVPVTDHLGEVSEVVHSFRDITKLKQADEAKTLFLSTASHELKTPLTVIRGFSQMLLLPANQMTDDERITALRAIDIRAAQLTGIVDRLLLSSRIESGEIDLVPEAVDVRYMVIEQVAGIRAATARDVDVRMHDRLPLVRVDVRAFSTVVDQLLDNAVKYSPGGGRIEVVLDVVNEDEVELVVTDEGVGMTEEQVSRCFDRFWQAEPTDMRRFGGTGIGLYIVRSLVEAMQGRISVVSAPGEGSRFRVVVSRADAGLPGPVNLDAFVEQP